MADMCAAPRKQAKAKRSNATSPLGSSATTAPDDAVGESTVGKSWTDRPDALDLLVNCAALLGIADRINSENTGFDCDPLAKRATELINACEFALKQEAGRTEARLKERRRKQEDRAFSTWLSFDEGACALLKLKDDRPERLELGIRRLLKSDFESQPRHPFGDDEKGQLRAFAARVVGRPPTLESFIDEELARYRSKGFSTEDFKRLAALSNNADKQ